MSGKFLQVSDARELFRTSVLNLMDGLEAFRQPLDDSGTCDQRLPDNWHHPMFSLIACGMWRWNCAVFRHSIVGLIR